MPENCGFEQIWGTALAIAVLKTRYSDKEGEWQLIVRKAMKWLKDQGAISMIEVALKVI